MLKEKSQGDNVEEWRMHGEQIELQIESEASHAVGWADAGQTTGTKEEQRGSGSSSNVQDMLNMAADTAARSEACQSIGNAVRSESTSQSRSPTHVAANAC